MSALRPGEAARLKAAAGCTYNPGLLHESRAQAMASRDRAGCMPSGFFPAVPRRVAKPSSVPSLLPDHETSRGRDAGASERTPWTT